MTNGNAPYPLKEPESAKVLRTWDHTKAHMEPGLIPVSLSQQLPFGAAPFTFDSPTLSAAAYYYGVGIRVFNQPCEAIIEDVYVAGGDRHLYPAPFDAAAFTLGGPPLPLRGESGSYGGETLRFCLQDFGCFSRQAPLRFTVSTYATPAAPPMFDAVLIVREVLPSAPLPDGSPT